MSVTRVIRIALSFLIIIPPPQPRNPTDIATLGRHYWWSIPLLEFCVMSFCIGVCLMLNNLTKSAQLAGAFFLLLSYSLQGLRSLDGLSDLSEGLFYRFSHPGLPSEKTWEVIRNPQNGPYGTAVIVLFLLFHWSLVTTLLTYNTRFFIVSVLFAGQLAKFSTAIAMAAPKHFKPESDFSTLAHELAKPVKQMALGCMVLGIIAWTGYWVLPGSSVFKGILELIILFLLAIISGFGSRWVIKKVLGALNGDLIGFSSCIANTAILLSMIIIWSM